MKYFDEDKPVTIKVVYLHAHDYPHVLNEFVWQTHDILPFQPEHIDLLTFGTEKLKDPTIYAEVVYVNWWGGVEYKKVDHIPTIQ